MTQEWHYYRCTFVHEMETNMDLNVKRIGDPRIDFSLGDLKIS